MCLILGLRLARDAIDAALIALHSAGQLLVTDSKTGEAIQPRDLDQNRIAKANFRTESVTLTGKDRIALKGLFQAVGIAVKPNDDLNLKARDFLDRMIELGRAAGGPPPLAPAPTTTHVDDMRKISGNEQLSKILEQKSTLQQQAGDWKKLGELADKRRPRWDKLQSLLKCGDGLKVLIPVQESATAIENDRLLLDATDHCTPLIKQTVDTLRSQLTNVREAHAAARKKEIARLEGADAWKKLTADEQMDLLRITPLPDEDTSSISSEDELLAALERVPLLHWQDRTNALPARIDSLLVAAIKRLVPKAQYVTLPSATIHDQRELDAWLAEVANRGREKAQGRAGDSLSDMDWNLKSFTAPSGELIRKEAQRDPELGFKLYVPMFNPALSEDKRQSFEVSQAKERAEGCGKYRLVASSSFEAHGDVLVKLIETLQRVGTEVRLLESENLYLTFTELYANAVTDSLVTDAKPRADPCDRNNYQQKG